MKTILFVILCAASGAFGQSAPTTMKAVVVHEVRAAGGGAL